MKHCLLVCNTYFHLWFMVLRCMTLCAHIHSPSQLQVHKTQQFCYSGCSDSHPSPSLATQKQHEQWRASSCSKVPHMPLFPWTSVLCSKFPRHLPISSWEQHRHCLLPSLERADWQTYMLINKPGGIFGFPKAEGSNLLLVYLAASFNGQLVLYGGRGRQTDGGRKRQKIHCCCCDQLYVENITSVSP